MVELGMLMQVDLNRCYGYFYSVQKNQITREYDINSTYQVSNIDSFLSYI